MTEVRVKGKKRTLSDKITVTSQEEKNRIIRHGIWFGGEVHRADNLVEISSDTLCSICCNLGYITLLCPNVNRAKFQLCAELHPSRNYKCTVKGCPTRAEREYKYTIVRCTNFRGTYYAISMICLMRK